MRRRVLLFVSLASAVAYACGGADPVTVGGDAGDGTTDDGGSSGRRDAGSRDGSISGSDGGVTGRDGGPRPDGGSGFDAGTPDAGGHPHNDGGITPAECGDVGDGGLLTCSAGAPTCCVTQGTDPIFGTTNTADYSCTPNAASCGGDAGIIPILCRDDRDCPGTKVCCGDLPGSSYTSIGCVEASACPLDDDAGLGTEFRRFCSIGDYDPCPSLGHTCQASGIVFGFDVCF